MKKTLIALSLSTVVLALAGCQDDNAPDPTASIDQAAMETEAPAPVVDATEIEMASIDDQQAVDQQAASGEQEWSGTYFGTLPCSDCEGIDVQITLNGDGSYSLNQTYVGKEDGFFESAGEFKWNEEGNIVTLENETGANQYLVGEGTLSKLDMNGEPVEGDLAAHYQLQKQS